MKAKPRWMKRCIEAARDDKTPLPFQRASKAAARVIPAKKAASA